MAPSTIGELTIVVLAVYAVGVAAIYGLWWAFTSKRRHRPIALEDF